MVDNIEVDGSRIKTTSGNLLISTPANKLIELEIKEAKWLSKKTMDVFKLRINELNLGFKISDPKKVVTMGILS